jgi:NO-binding membrane sensor protein with MHYT domain
MTYLAPSLDVWPLVLSACVGALTCLVLLDLAQRVGGTERVIGRLWWLGGSIVAGTGFWAAHFLAMSAHVLPIPIGYAGAMTFVSWLCGVGAAGMALSIAMRADRNPLHLVGSACIVGATLCIMHHTAVAAIEFAPGVHWDPAYVTGSVGAAIVFAAAALSMFSALRHTGGWRRVALQVVGAVVLATTCSASTRAASPRCASRSAPCASARSHSTEAIWSI